MTRARDPSKIRHAELEAELSERFAGPVMVAGWRAGFDYHADLASMAGRWTRVVLSPRVEVLDTAYEGSVDFGDVIRRQAMAYAATRSAGLLVPAVHLALHRGESMHGHSVLVLERIPDDESWSKRSDRQLGGLVRRLHAMPGRVVEDGKVNPSASWLDIVGDRLERRLSAARRHLALPDVIDVKGILSAELSPDVKRPLDRLLHMDVRRSNICVTDQRIEGLIDFANVISGDPLFELARIRYCGLLSEDFLRGYGIDDPDSWSQANRRLLALYEMDVASLLVTVAAEEAHAPGLFTRACIRLRDLVGIVGESRVGSGLGSPAL